MPIFAHAREARCLRRRLVRSISRRRRRDGERREQPGGGGRRATEAANARTRSKIIADSPAASKLLRNTKVDYDYQQYTYGSNDDSRSARRRPTVAEGESQVARVRHLFGRRVRVSGRQSRSPIRRASSSRLSPGTRRM